MGELYGQANVDTQEWTDGLASKIIRKFASQEGHDKLANTHRQFWTVFDGPVDAKWIENMNTVLDDNMQLSLPNGERIKLHIHMHMVFEAEDMTQASPATVSRLGMVYMTPSDLGWLPYLNSWITQYLGNDLPDGSPDGPNRSMPLLATEIIEYFREHVVSILTDAF
jgi:dynein heavy chain, axonemal